MNLRLLDAYKEAGRDARALLEAVVLILATWLLLGWWFGEPLMRGDGPRLFAPYLRSALEAGTDWTDNQYRFGSFGGSAMHPAFGTSPLVLLCSALGVTTTTAGNVGVLFTQLCFGFFAIVMIEALLTIWSGSRRRLTVFERAVTIWCCAFAPVIGWRFAAGHENLVQGLLPWLAAVSLWWSARAKTLSITALLVGWLAVFHALPSLGQQTLVYSLVFGAPVMIVTLVGGRHGRAVAYEHVAVILALGAGALCAAPLYLDMIQYQLGDDASRGAARSMFYAYGHPYPHDWLTSLPWTTTAVEHWPGKIPAHETNYPLGPLILFALALWPRGVGRELGFAVIIGVLLAITFSLDLSPIAPLLRGIPMVDAFRVPARAMLAVLMVVPPVALAVLWSRVTDPGVGRRQWGMLGVALIAILVARVVPSVAREFIAWIACGTICVVLRRLPTMQQGTVIAAAIAGVAALGVSAFEERYDTAKPAQRIEDEPATLREHVLAKAPDLAMPLTRVQVPDRPPPFGKSSAFAAGLPTLDGVGFPPRRFLRLLSALWNEPVSPAEADFELTHRDRFDLLAQLYNVNYVLEPSSTFTRLESTNGPAWFTRDVVLMDDPREMIRVLRSPGIDVRAVLARVAWVLRDEAPMLRTDAACADARVINVTPDRFGQSADLEVVLDGTCVLVVATNYASMLRATDTRQELEVFPVDVALTGIVVPSGTTLIKLGPRGHRQWWWALLGCFALGGALAVLLFKARQRPRSAR